MVPVRTTYTLTFILGETKSFKTPKTAFRFSLFVFKRAVFVCNDLFYTASQLGLENNPHATVIHCCNYNKQNVDNVNKILNIC